MYFSFQKHAFLSNFGKGAEFNESAEFSPNIKNILPKHQKPQRKVMNKENSQGKYESDTDH